MHRLSSGTREFVWDVLGSLKGHGRDGSGVQLCRLISDAFDETGEMVLLLVGIANLLLGRR
jgi:hypothetical protein